VYEYEGEYEREYEDRGNDGVLGQQTSEETNLL
jgi:hypothetical protein